MMTSTGYSNSWQENKPQPPHCIWFLKNIFLACGFGAFPPKARCTAFQADGSGGFICNMSPHWVRIGRWKWCIVMLFCFNQSNAMAISVNMSVLVALNLQIHNETHSVASVLSETYLWVFEGPWTWGWWLVMVLSSNWIMGHLRHFFWSPGVMSLCKRWDFLTILPDCWLQFSSKWAWYHFLVLQ